MKILSHLFQYSKIVCVPMQAEIISIEHIFNKSFQEEANTPEA